MLLADGAWPLGWKLDRRSEERSVTDGVRLCADCHIDVKAECADAERVCVWVGGCEPMDGLGDGAGPRPFTLASKAVDTGAHCMYATS
jgi:hypothetical protein